MIAASALNRSDTPNSIPLLFPCILKVLRQLAMSDQPQTQSLSCRVHRTFAALGFKPSCLRKKSDSQTGSAVAECPRLPSLSTLYLEQARLDNGQSTPLISQVGRRALHTDESIGHRGRYRTEQAVSSRGRVDKASISHPDLCQSSVDIDQSSTPIGGTLTPSVPEDRGLDEEHTGRRPLTNGGRTLGLNWASDSWATIGTSTSSASVDSLHHKLKPSIDKISHTPHGTDERLSRFRSTAANIARARSLPAANFGFGRSQPIDAQLSLSHHRSPKTGDRAFSSPPTRTSPHCTRWKDLRSSRNIRLEPPWAEAADAQGRRSVPLVWANRAQYFPALQADEAECKQAKVLPSSRQTRQVTKRQLGEEVALLRVTVDCLNARLDHVKSQLLSTVCELQNSGDDNELRKFGRS